MNKIVFIVGLMLVAAKSSFPVQILLFRSPCLYLQLDKRNDCTLIANIFLVLKMSLSGVKGAGHSWPAGRRLDAPGLEARTH